MPTINGRKVVNFRLVKVEEKVTRDKDDYAQYEEPKDSDFDQPHKTKYKNYTKCDMLHFVLLCIIFVLFCRCY